MQNVSWPTAFVLVCTVLVGGGLLYVGESNAAAVEALVGSVVAALLPKLMKDAS